MKYKNFIRRMLAGVLSVLILLGDVGSLGLSAYAADETPTEIIELTEAYTPGLDPADTVPGTAPEEAPTEPDVSTVSEGETPADTAAAEDPVVTEPEKVNEPSSEEDTEEDAEQPEADAAGSEGSDTATEPTDSSDVTDKEPVESDAAKQESQPATEPEQPQQPAGEAPEEAKDPSALSVAALTAGSKYATANVSAIKYSAVVAGGTAPYQVHFAVKLSNAVCHEQTVELAVPEKAEFSYIPVSGGVHEIVVTVTDSLGAAASSVASMPVSSGETEDYAASVHYVNLSGDWATDVMNMALSQIGKSENQLNFIIDEEDNYRYYSIYGDSYGEPHADWSALFAAFCLKMAQIPAEAFPVDKDAEKFAALLNDKGIYKSAAEYEPVPGDIAFLTEGRVGVVSVAGNGEVYIIWGGPSVTVKQEVLQQTDPSILGYGSIALAKDVYENGPIEEPAEEPEEKPEEPVIENPQVILPESVEMSVWPAASRPGDTVTFSANLPADIDPESLIYTWQISPDGVEWMDMHSSTVPSYTLETSARHYLNYLRVTVSADPEYVKPKPVNEAEAGEAMPENTENNSQPESDEQPQAAAAGANADIASMAKRPLRRILRAASDIAAPAAVSSGGIMLLALADEDAVYWNPYGSNTYSEDGVIIVAAGNDANDGTEAAPVLSLAAAISKAGANKTIVCMNLYNSYGDESLESSSNAVKIVGYEGGEEGDAAAHEGMFISSKSGVLVVMNLHTDPQVTGPVIEANGGEIYLQSGNNIPGTIYINKLSSNYLPISVSAFNADSGKYTIDFNPDFVGTVGIAKGTPAANAQYLQLSQSLTDKGWSFKEVNGHTYAHIPPHYEAVYIDGINGSDANLGNSEEFPVRTFDKAKALMSENSINTLYVMGTVALTDGNDDAAHSFWADSAIARRHVSCTGSMFEISSGEHTVSFAVSGGVESGENTVTASDAAVFNVTGGKLTVSGSASITDAASYAITMSGGSLDLSACNGNISSDGIVKGSAANVNLNGSSLSSNTKALADITVSGIFTAIGATLSGPANNTLILGGQAQINNSTVNTGAGSVKLSSGKLEIDGTNLSAIDAAGIVDAKNASITSINNSGSATTIDAVSVSTLISRGVTTVKNGSTVSAKLESTGTSLVVAGSTVGSIETAATVDASGTVEIDNSNVYAPVTATGDVSIKNTSTVSKAVSSSGDVSVDGSTVSGGISGAVLDIVNSNVSTLNASSNVTVSGSVSGAVTARGDADIDDSTVNGVMNISGDLDMAGSSTQFNVTVNGDATVSDSEISNTSSTATLTVEGSSTITGGADRKNIDNAVLASSTITGMNIATLTASGDTTLVSGAITSLISDANVTAQGGSIGTLELRGDNTYLFTGGTYNASVPVIKLSGADSYIKLQGVPADNTIGLTIAREYDGRLVVEGVDGYKASDVISRYSRTGSNIYKLESDGSNIVIEGPNGVYVSTQYPGTPNTNGYGTQVDNPARSFDEAVQILNGHPEFARIINVIGTMEISSGDSLNVSGDTVTVVPYSDAGHPAVNTLIHVPQGVGFSVANADFDGAGLSGSSTLFDVDGTLSLNGERVLSNANTIIDNTGTVSLGSSKLTAKSGGTVVRTSAGNVSGNNVKLNVDGAGTGIAISGGSLNISGGSSAITIGGAGTGVNMSGGTINALAGSITVEGAGKGLVKTCSGTATVGANINVKTAGSIGVDIDGGTLKYSGSIYGKNAMTIDNAVVNFSGRTASATGYSNTEGEGHVVMNNGTLNVTAGTISSFLHNNGTTTISGGTIYNMTMETGTLNSTGGTVSNLTMNNGRCNVTAGTGSGSSSNIYNFKQNNGTTTISGGTVYNHTLNKGSVTVSSNGNLQYITVNGSLADSTLNVTGGNAYSISQYGGVVTVSGGSVNYAKIYKGTSGALLYANGGSISETSLLGPGSVLHTNGYCDLGDVKIGSGSSGRDSYIELSDVLHKNSADNPIEISDIANENYNENYCVVIPKDGSNVDASKELSKFRYDDRVEERFILAGGGDDKPTHIVLSFEGVFIDTENGDDTNDGLSYNNPVRTFARAGAVLKGRIDNDPDVLRVIYVVDKTAPYSAATATVRESDSLDMSNAKYSGSYVMPFANSCDTLVKVEKGASFSLTGARIDGVGNNTATRTATVMEVAGSLSMSNAQLINARGTVLKLSGTATFNNSSIYPYTGSSSSATGVSLLGGTLDMNSSSISSGRYGVDMSGGKLDMDSSSSISSAYTGLRLSNGEVILNGDIRSSSYTGIEMSGGKVTQSSSANVDSNGSYYNGSSKGGVYMSGGEYIMSGGSINSNRGYSSAGGLTVAGGSFTGTGGSINNNYSNSNGGGVALTSGSLSLDGTSISNNYAAYYSATTGKGGGLYISGGEAELKNLSISSNHASRNSSTSTAMGGGVYISGGSLTMSSVNVTGNYTYGGSGSKGGGLCIDGGSISMTGGSITSNNSSGKGGGVYTGASGSMTISGVNINSNTASSDGGGVYWSCGNSGSISGGSLNSNKATGGNGGGIYISGSASAHDHGFSFSSISSNSAVNGGAVYNLCDTQLDLSGCTGGISSNTATSGNGGAVYMAKGSISLPSTMTGNKANNGNGGAVYLQSGTVSGSNVNFSGSSAEKGNGGVIYVNSGTVTLPGSTLSTTTSKASAKAGGAVYMADGTVDLSGSTITGSTATDGNGGAVYMVKGSLTLDNANISSSASGADEDAKVSGGAVYMQDGTLNMRSATVTGSATDKGGAVYMAKGTATMDDSSITGSGANQGGGLYVGGGSVSLLKNGETASSVTGSVSGDEAEGAAIYLEKGVTEFFGSATTGTGSAASAHTVYIGSDADLNHRGGTVTGDVHAVGDYQLTLPEAFVDGEINLMSREHPLVIDPDSTGNGENVFKINANKSTFAEALIVDGTTVAPARKVQFSISTTTDPNNITNATEVGDDILGGQSMDVYLNPQGDEPGGYSGLASSDDNMGGTPATAVSSFNRAMELLATKGPLGRIVLMSSASVNMCGTEYDGMHYTGTGKNINSAGDKNTVGTEYSIDWKAKIVRYHSESYTFTDTMFVGANNISNLVISGEAHNDGSIVAIESNTYVIYPNDVGTFKITNSEICNHTASIFDYETSVAVTLKNCSVHDCTYTNGNQYESLIGAPGAPLTLDNTKVYNCLSDNDYDYYNVLFNRQAKLSIVNNSVISNFTSAEQGGALINSSGAVEISDSRIENNFVSSVISIRSTSPATLERSVISGNDCSSSAISVSDLTADTCTFENNTSDSDGTVISVYSNGNEIKNCTFTNNISSGSNGGGAIAAKSGELTITNSSFTGNEAVSGGAVYASGSSLSISGGTYSNNKATGQYGGAVYLEEGSLTISGGSFNGNEAPMGGAVYVAENSSANIGGNSSFKNNIAKNDEGGAIYFGENVSVALSNASFEGNKSEKSSSGAIHFSQNIGFLDAAGQSTTTLSGLSFKNNSASNSGGAFVLPYSLTLENFTFEGNTAGSNGGAIHATNDTTIQNSKFIGNETQNGRGGAVNVVEEKTVTVRSSEFTGNKAINTQGAAIAAGKTSITGSTFTDNKANLGVLYLSNQVSISDSSFTGNYTTQDGSAVYCWLNPLGGTAEGSYLRISNVTVENNESRYGPIFSMRIAEVDIKDSVISNNNSRGANDANPGAGIRLFRNTDKTGTKINIENCHVDNNTGMGLLSDGVNNSTYSSAKISGGSFSGNSLCGISFDCGNLYQGAGTDTAGRRFEIKDTVISGNGDSGLKLAGNSSYNGMAGLENVTISNNGDIEKTKYGGGIFVGKYVTIFLDDSVSIRNNEAQMGGAIYWEQNTAFTQDGEGAVLSGNKAKQGGAFYVNQPVNLGGFVVENNEAEQGGGMYVNMKDISGNVVLMGDAEGHPTQFVGNKAAQGGAIYIGTATSDEHIVDIQKAVISGNTVTGSNSPYSTGIYNEGSRLYMSGDEVEIEDNIYLQTKGRHIYLRSGLSDAVYNIAVNMDTGAYSYGDVVVSPAKNSSINAAQYLRSTNALVPGSVFAKGQCGEHQTESHSAAVVDSIVLKSCIFVDGTKTVSGDGTTPAKAFATMEEALQSASAANAVIYICGTVSVTGNETWSNNTSPVELRRYTGFSIGGEINDEEYGQAFICKGDMISVEAGASLTLGKNVGVVAGSHNANDTISAEGSIFDVSGTLVLSDTISIEANYSSADGSAIKVNNGGTVTVKAAVSISDCSGANGGAINNMGTVNVTSGSLSISDCSASGNGDSVYNGGEFIVAAGQSFNADGAFYIAKDKFLTLGSSTAKINENMEPLFIDIEAPVDQRVYVSYKNTFSDEATEEAKFKLSSSITSSFLREAGADKKSLILSQSNIVYVGNTVIDDTLTKGYSADNPFKTLKEAYEKLRELGGGLIYLVDTVNVSGDVTVGNNVYSDSTNTVTLTDGGVSIRRYSQPTNFEPDGSKAFTALSNIGSLFNVTGSGSLTLDGIVVDGHNYDIDTAGADTQFTIAPAVTSTAAMVTLSGSGSLTVKNGASLVSNTSSSRADAIDHNGGSVTLSGSSVDIDGRVYLDTNKVITVDHSSLSPAASLDIVLADAYDGRVIAQYTKGENSAPDAGEVNKYSLTKDVAEQYRLCVDTNADTVILRTNRAVYVDGVNGDDNNVGVPDSPIKTLRKAYELLSAYGGTIYIVNTVTVGGGADIALGSKQFYDGETVTVQSGDVAIVRYSRPTAYSTLNGYSRGSFTNGSLIKLEQGASLTLANISIDGHNTAKSGSANTAALAINGGGALISVGGSLLLDGASLVNNTNDKGRGGAMVVLGSGSVLMRGGASIRGNKDAEGDNAVFLSGKLDIGGNINFAADQWVYENNKYIDVSASFSGTVPVELPVQDVDSGKVIAKYAAGLQPDADQFSLTQANMEKAEALNIAKTEVEQDVVLKASYAVTYTLSNVTKGVNAPVLAASDEQFNTSIKAASGHVLPQGITVKVTPLEYVSVGGKFQAQDGTPVTLTPVLDYSYDPEKGTITVFKDNVYGKLEIIATGIPVHNISYVFEPSGSARSKDGNPASVLGAQGFDAVFYPNTGYENLSIKSITVGGTALTANSDYTAAYDTLNEQLELAVNGSAVTGAVVVTVSATLKQYNIGEQIEGVSMTTLPDKIAYHEGLAETELELENPDAYEMPESVQVFVGSRELVSGEDFTYAEGKLSIKEGLVDADVRITGTAKIKTFDLRFNLTPSGALQSVNAPAKLEYGAELSTGISLSNSTKYALPTAISVTIGGNTFTGFNYDATTGSISIPEGKITGDVVITADAREIYAVEYSYVNTQVEAASTNPSTIIEGSGLSASFTAKTGYQIDSVTVKLGNATTAIASSFTNGTLTVAEGLINAGPVKVTVTSSLKKYGITYSGTDTAKGDNGITEASHGQVFTTYIKAKDVEGVENVRLPDSITVSVQGVGNLTAGTDYSYDSSTGKITITETGKAKITGPVTITANGVHQHKVSYNFNDKLKSKNSVIVDEGAAHSFTIEASKTNVRLPETITVKIGDVTQTVNSAYSYNSTSGVVSIPAGKITDDVEIIANGTEYFTVTYATNVSGSVTLPAASTVDEKAAYNANNSIKFTAAEGKYITGVTVMVGNTALANSQYTFTQTKASVNNDTTSGSVSIAENIITGNLVITVNTADRIYNVSEDMNNAGIVVKHGETADDSTPTVTHKEKDVSITINPDTGYDAPDSVTVTVTDPDGKTANNKTLVAGRDYTYTKNADGTGTITITNTAITGSIKVSGTPVLETYDVSYNLGKLLTTSDTTKKAQYGVQYTTSISVASGSKGNVTLPESVDVWVGSKIDANKLAAGTDYSYSNGSITINTGKITGPVFIEARGKQTFTVTVSGSNCTAIPATATIPSVSETNASANFVTTITAAEGYVVPTDVEVKLKDNTVLTNTANKTYYTYETGTDAEGRKTATLTIYGSSITDNITVTATAVKLHKVSFVANPQNTVNLPETQYIIAGSAMGSVSFTAVAGWAIDSVKQGNTAVTGYVPGNETANDDVTSGSVSFAAGVITGDTTVTINTVKRQYTVTNTGDNTDIDKDDSDNDKDPDTVQLPHGGNGEDITITLTPDPGYDPPESVTIIVKDPDYPDDEEKQKTLEEGTDYKYEDGVITILDPSEITGPIEISGDATLKEYTITESVTNATAKDETSADSTKHVQIPEAVDEENPYTITHGDELKVKLYPDTDNGYIYPDSVTVTIGGESFTGFQYDQTNGTITIPATVTDDDDNDNKVTVITGPIVIGGAAKLRSYSVSGSFTNVSGAFAGVTEVKDKDGNVTGRTVEHKKPAGDAEAVTVTLTEVTGYNLPNSVTVTIGGTAYTDFTYENGVITIPKEAITGNIEVTASGVIENYAVTYKYIVGTTAGGYGSADGATTVDYHAAYTSTVSAKGGYRITDIEVKTGSTELGKQTGITGSTTFATGSIFSGSKTENDDFTSLNISIPKDTVTGEVTVTVTLAKRQYTVTNTGENTKLDPSDTTSPNEDTVYHGDTDGVVITPDPGYDAPDSVTITIKDPDGEEDNKTVTIDKGETDKDTGYSYTVDNSGNIVITPPEGGITGPIDIDADGEKETYNVSYDFDPAASKGDVKQDNKTVIDANGVHANGLSFATEYKTSITVARGYKINSISVSRGTSPLTKDIHFSYTTAAPGDTLSSVLTINAVSIPGALTVTVNASKRQYSITESVDNADVKLGEDIVPSTPGTNDPKINDGEKIVLEIKPEDGYTYPDEITVTITDPDDPDAEEKEVTVKQGETNTDTGIEYKVETDPETGETTATVTIPGSVEDDDGNDVPVITGPITVSGEARQLFDVNVSIEPVKDAENKPDYTRTDTTKDVTVAGAGESVAVEKHGYDSLKLTAETGYTIVSIDIKVGESGEVITIPVNPSGTVPSGYGYANDGTVTIPATVKDADGKVVPVITGDVSVTVNTQRTRYDVEYQLGDDPETTDKDESMLEVDTKYKDEPAIHGEGFTTKLNPKDQITLPDTITSITIGNTVYDNIGENHESGISYDPDTGVIIIPATKTIKDGNDNEVQVPMIDGRVIINASGVESFTAEYTLTLVADDISTNNTVELNLINAEAGATLARLKGKRFKIESITGIASGDSNTLTTSGEALVPSSLFTPIAKTDSGFTVANSKFGITVGGADFIAKDDSVTVPDSGKLSFTIHNANAITTAADITGIVITLKSDIGDTVTIKLTIDRVPSQLNVTVPLVLVMKTNIDGGSVDMSDSTYSIENKSSMRVQLTGAEVADTSDVMSKSDTSSFTGSDQFYVDTIADDNTDDYIAAGKSIKPIESIATSPLSFVTKDDAEYGLHMATVTYTVAIPE